MNMNDVVKRLDARMDRIENSLDTLANNHIAHIEKYTRWTLVGVLVSTGLSLTVVAITVL